MRFRVIQHTQFQQRARGGEPGDHFSALVADLHRLFDRRHSTFPGLGHLGQVDQVPRHHVCIANRNTAEAMGAGQSDATAEIIQRRDHSSLRIISVAKPAQRARLAFRRCGPFRRFQGLPVLGQTAFDVGEWKIQIAPIVVDIGKFLVESPGARHLFCLCQCSESLVVIVGYPHARRQTDPGPAAGDVVVGSRQRLPVNFNRICRTPGFPQAFSFEHEKAVAGCGRCGQFFTPVEQVQGLVEMKSPSLGKGRVGIGVGRPRILRPIEMLGVQCKVPFGKPFGGLLVESPPSRMKQGRVDAVADKRVGETKSLVLRADQQMLD